MNRYWSCKKKQQGLATVEFALTVPLLLVIMLITAEFSRVFYQYNTLTKSVRDGSRHLAQSTLTGNLSQGVSAAILNETRQLVVTGSPSGGDPLLLGLSTDDITFDFSAISDGGFPRHYVKVTANYQFQPLAPILGTMGVLDEATALNFILTASSSMRAQ